MSAQAKKANANLDLSGKTAVIVGASQGIGAGVAIRFARAGANIIIVGRSIERLEKVIADAKKVARSNKQTIDYVSADLYLVSATKTAAREIQQKAQGQIDYLVQTQGGTPSGLFELTSEGIEKHFAVQVLSRFHINHILATSGSLKGTSISILQPGGTETEFNLDDIELPSTKNNAQIPNIPKHAARDVLVADTYTSALQRKFPKIKFFHVFPGLVQTNVMMNQNVPFPVKQLVTYIVYPIAARTFGNTIESYADIPVFLAANEEAKDLVEKEGYFLDNKNKKAELSPYAKDEKNQEAILGKLMAYLK